MEKYRKKKKPKKEDDADDDNAHSDDELLDSEQYSDGQPAHEVPWVRTLFAATAFVVIVIGIDILLLFTTSLWISIGIAFLMTLVMGWIATKACNSLYSTSHSYKFRRQTTLQALSQTVMLGVFFAAVGGVWSGFFFREYFTGCRTAQDNINVHLPAVSNAGKLYFENGALPRGNLGAYATVGWGWFPTCVAPIATEDTQSTVSYWAVHNGGCCAEWNTNIFLKCQGWDQQQGGIYIKYTEMLPNAIQAKKNALSNHPNLNEDPNALFVLWSNPVSQCTQLLNRGLIICFAALGIAFLLMVGRAKHADYY